MQFFTRRPSMRGISSTLPATQSSLPEMNSTGSIQLAVELREEDSLIFGWKGEVQVVVSRAKINSGSQPNPYVKVHLSENERAIKTSKTKTQRQRKTDAPDFGNEALSVAVPGKAFLRPDAGVRLHVSIWDHQTMHTCLGACSFSLATLGARKKISGWFLLHSDRSPAKDQDAVQISSFSTTNLLLAGLDSPSTLLAPINPAPMTSSLRGASPIATRSTPTNLGAAPAPVAVAVPSRRVSAAIGAASSSSSSSLSIGEEHENENENEPEDVDVDAMDGVVGDGSVIMGGAAEDEDQLIFHTSIPMSGIVEGDLEEPDMDLDMNVNMNVNMSLGATMNMGTGLGAPDAAMCAAAAAATDDDSTGAIDSVAGAVPFPSTLVPATAVPAAAVLAVEQLREHVIHAHSPSSSHRSSHRSSSGSSSSITSGGTRRMSHGGRRSQPILLPSSTSSPSATAPASLSKTFKGPKKSSAGYSPTASAATAPPAKTSSSSSHSGTSPNNSVSDESHMNTSDSQHHGARSPRAKRSHTILLASPTTMALSARGSFFVSAAGTSDQTHSQDVSSELSSPPSSPTAMTTGSSASASPVRPQSRGASPPGVAGASPAGRSVLQSHLEKLRAHATHTKEYDATSPSSTGSGCDSPRPSRSPSHHEISSAGGSLTALGMGTTMGAGASTGTGVALARTDPGDLRARLQEKSGSALALKKELESSRDECEALRRENAELAARLEEEQSKDKDICNIISALQSVQAQNRSLTKQLQEEREQHAKAQQDLDDAQVSFQVHLTTLKYVIDELTNVREGPACVDPTARENNALRECLNHMVLSFNSMHRDAGTLHPPAPSFDILV